MTAVLRGQFFALMLFLRNRAFKCKPICANSQSFFSCVLGFSLLIDVSGVNFSAVTNTASLCNMTLLDKLPWSQADPSLSCKLASVTDESYNANVS